MSDDLKKKANEAADAATKLASAGLEQGRALAGQAGAMLGGLFHRAKETVESIAGDNTEAMTALKNLIAAQDAVTVAMSAGLPVDTERANLAVAWVKAREVASKA